MGLKKLLIYLQLKNCGSIWKITGKKNLIEIAKSKIKKYEKHNSDR